MLTDSLIYMHLILLFKEWNEYEKFRFIIK